MSPTLGSCLLPVPPVSKSFSRGCLSLSLTAWEHSDLVLGTCPSGPRAGLVENLEEAIST